MALLVEHYFETNFSNIDQGCLTSIGRASKLITTLCPTSTQTNDTFKGFPSQQEDKFNETHTAKQGCPLSQSSYFGMAKFCFTIYVLENQGVFRQCHAGYS